MDTPAMTASPPPASAAAKTILIVEDEASLVSTLSYNFRKNGFNVVTATDGFEGLQAARRENPDAIVLDLMLPKMDGYEVARRLRASPGTRAALVALTGWGQDEDRRRVREAGFDHHLVKPADFATLQSLISSIQAGGR
jgi:DNA-binding response OmpR family regulator